MPTKQEIIKAIAILWIVSTTSYIVYGFWNDYKVKGIGQAYQTGVSDTLKQIFDKSKENDCKQSLELSVGSDKLEMIDVKCVPQPSSANQPASPTGGPQAAAQGAQLQPPLPEVTKK